MEQLRKIGQVCVAHYEKVLLSVMLLALGIAVWILWQETQNEAEKLRQFSTGLERGRTKGVQELDTSTNRAVLAEVANARPIAIGGAHLLFNPVKWQRRPDGPLLKIQSSKDAGVEALVINQVRPLYFTIIPERVLGDGACYMALTNEVTPIVGRERVVYMSPAQVNRTNISRHLILRDVRNPTNDTEWVLELTDPRAAEERSVVVAKDKPFRRVEGFEAELKYPPGNKTFSKLRVGTNYVIRLEGEDYKVVAISPDEVVLSGRLNEQPFHITQKAGP
jgi:hypothetical protein